MNEEEKKTDKCKEFLNMMIWCYRIGKSHSDVKDMEATMETIINDPRMSGHFAKCELMAIYVQLKYLSKIMNP